MQKTFWLDSRISKVNVDDSGELKIAGYASTVDTDRAGDVILPEAWAKGGLENFKANPIILFNHDYGAPIGRVVRMEVDEKGLYVEAIISKAAKQFELIKDGVLTTFSVGFLIKDADYNKSTGGYVIKDAELLETSVVTVPCNQGATFSLSKSFTNDDELRSFLKKELKLEPEVQTTEAEANATHSEPVGNEAELEAVERNKNMSIEIENAVQKALADADAKRAEAAKKAAEVEAATKALEEKAATAAANAVKSTAEALQAEMAKTFEDGKTTIEDMQKQFKEAIEVNKAEFAAMRDSKRLFADRGAPAGDLKAFEADMESAYLLGRVTGKGYDTNFGKQLKEKVNQHSTVEVSSDLFETTVSTNIERDIQNELVVTKLFREIMLNSKTLVLPIMPDAGYAEITAATSAAGDQPYGNMDKRGAAHGTPYGGIPMEEVHLDTIKMISLAYLGNETEEDAILPILPLIRDSMIRSHARGVENMILAGNDVEGVYTANARDGLIKMTRTGGRQVTQAAANTPLTAAQLLSMRKVMGKYGVNPQDVVYVVSQDGYFDLLQDAEFQDVNLVGNVAVKLKGELGAVYGSKVIMSDEFAPAGAGKTKALAINTRNFLVPRLRGLTVESDYEVRHQRKVLVTSQRLGFNELIKGATSVVGLQAGA